MKISLFDSKTLFIILASGQGIALVYSSVVLDGNKPGHPLFWIALATGLLLGVGAAFSASFAGHKLSHWRGGKNSTARIVGIAALGLQITCTFVVTAICRFGAPEGWLRWAASGAFALMVESSIVAVAAVSAAVFSDSAAQSEKPAQPAAVSEMEAPHSESHSAAQSDNKPKAPLTCPHCEAVGAHPVIESEAQRSGHIAWCINNPNNRRRPLTRL